MAVKRKLFPAAKASASMNAKKIRTLERNLRANRSETRIDTHYSSADLTNRDGTLGLNGCVNTVIDDGSGSGVVGRNYKTLSVKASFAYDELYAVASGNADKFRYRMILFSNKNDSSRANTSVGSGEIPAPYGGASTAPEARDHLNFDIDRKKFIIYDDKTTMTQRQIIDLEGISNNGIPTLSVSHQFKTPKLVRFPSDGDDPSHGMIGLVIWRQEIETGLITNSTGGLVNAYPSVITEHKWIDP